MREIVNIFDAPTVMMGPIELKQAIPTGPITQISPFILLHHFDMHIEPGVNSFHVPPHPHRGFCPITFMFDGSVMHRDSLGNEQEIHSNEVQWINAARGLIHSETISDSFVEQGGRLQGIQLWINLPSAEKMKPPTYQPITQSDIPIEGDENFTVRVISGRIGHSVGLANNPNTTAMITAKSGGQFTWEPNQDSNTLLYLLEGSMKINGTQVVTQHQMTAFKIQEGAIQLESLENSKALIMSGKPIQEPLVTHGPFVMNSQTEILEAMRDYQQGKMGFLY